MTAPERAWPAGVSAGQPFGHLEVIRTGVRGGCTADRPRGFPAAECTCHGPGCGRTVVVPVYRLLNGNTKSCGCGACFRPRKGSIRDRIVAYVAAEGGAWMTQIRDHLGLSSGAAGGHLHYLTVTAGRLARPVRGFYCLPGQVPDPIPDRSTRRTSDRLRPG
jgi:hypothetical protein